MLQLIPCDFKLSFGALVIVAIHARVLNQNIKAVHEGARGGGSVGMKCRCVVNSALLRPLNGG
jgi:hypothetical protein